MKRPNPLFWQAYEYEARERGADWFWAVGIITVSLAVTAIILNNVLFAFVIVLSGFALSLFASRPPKEVDVTVDDRGILVEKYFYPYRSLESFWVDEHETQPKLLLKSQRLFMPYITIFINPEDVEVRRVKQFLSRYLPEVFHEDTPLHRFMEYLGF
jgi:hypothetical protein